MSPGTFRGLNDVERILSSVSDKTLHALAEANPRVASNSSRNPASGGVTETTQPDLSAV